MILFLVIQEVYLWVFSTKKYYKTTNQKQLKGEHTCVYIFKNSTVGFCCLVRGKNKCQEEMSSIKIQILSINISMSPITWSLVALKNKKTNFTMFQDTVHKKFW